ncbi:MAG: hypothetical protein M1814_003672 [Vezdaea aestivalis]|nr:MAG: hypothetical protein M1814_003672 [Vezdaea aestivalis]
MKVTNNRVLTALGLLFAVTNEVKAVCNFDNCYRAFYPTGSPAQISSASDFCATYTTTTNTASTGFPTRATSACGASPSKYSSVCSCRPTSTSNPTACPSTYPDDQQFHNGGFECPTYFPWEPQLAPGTQYQLSSPGAAGSAKAFEFYQTGPPAREAHSAQARLIQTIYGLTIGKKYRLGYSTWINRYGAGFWGLMINGEPQQTVDAADFGGPGVWNYVTFDFTATVVTNYFIFEVITGEVGTIFKLDNVTLVPL